MTKQKQPQPQELEQHQDQPQDLAPTVPTTDEWTPAQKATAVAMIAGGAVGTLAANPNGAGPSPSVERGKPAVTVVHEIPNRYPNTITLPDGSTAVWTPPADMVVKLAENDKGGLTATRTYGNRVAFDLPVPTPGTQAEGSPQQAADPNSTMEFTPVPDKNPYTNDLMEPVTLTEDGKGGLTAERMGKEVAGVIHMGMDGTAGFTEYPYGALGPATKDGNLTPKPGEDLPGVPIGKNPAPPTDGQPLYLNTDHNGDKIQP